MNPHFGDANSGDTSSGDACPTCGADFLRWLDADVQRREAWRALPRRAVAAGQTLQRPGRPATAVWFVEQGLLRSHVLDAEGRERNCAFHPEAQWAGMPPSRTATPVSPLAVSALQASRVVELGHAALAAWLARSPELQAALIDALSATWAAMSRREASLLMDSAEQRYLRFLAEQPDIASRIALHQVASYLGITDVALSRIRRRLRALRGPRAPR